jgi:calpain-15
VNKDGKICIFADGITPNDILQGGLGDCYYLSSLSVLAEKENRIKKLFEHD